MVDESEEQEHTSRISGIRISVHGNHHLSVVIINSIFFNYYILVRISIVVIFPFLPRSI